MRKTLAAAGMLAFALALGACAGGGAPDSGADSEARSLVAAISERVAEEGSAAVKFTMDVAGQKITGKGAARFADAVASEVTVDAGGQQTEVRYVGGSVYVKAPQYLSQMMDKGKTWVDLSDEQSAQMLRGIVGLAKQGDLTHTLAQIKRAGTVKKSEQTKIDGQPATQHTIDMRIDKLDEFPFGLGKEFREKFTAAGVKTYQMKLSVSDDKLPVILSMNLADLYAAITAGQPQPPGGDPAAPTPEAPKAKASVTVTYSEWGEPVDIKAPPKDKIGSIKQPKPQMPQQNPKPKPSK